ncbi:winged helix-turn-helix transcriptional regulator [Actinomycetospora sp. TBRC 11914]|uniref:winged helix-turn-helix transcriptional regulator n=1 Tax=Actinomycetospora sp. TBRC 11914 TaxID=2729387 RepID=UPI00145FD02B|nr:winged helix-turn-helix transcriptional regulator [Actinomycetospora sp. TBRC 11914]NMO88449.1 transcriptional regulator [Actinomycetospora sp. TBRC 11914]
MRHDELGDVYCSVARTWSVIGERWTMMILRECFRGERRYDHFRTKLGLGANVLNDRLRVLTEEGVLERVRYQDSPPRHEYRLTAKGADLYPVLVALMAWGDRHENDVPPVRLVHRGCGHRAEPRMTCAHCGEPVAWREMAAEMEPTAW